MNFPDTVPIKKLRPEARVPTRATPDAAGYDLFACTGQGVTRIPPHSTVLIGTGISVALPQGTFGAMFARSGLAVWQGLRPANCVGVCDSDYRGEYKVPLHNDSDVERTIADGDRIAQLIILPFLAPTLQEVDSLDDTARGEQGFGSTGV